MTPRGRRAAPGRPSGRTHPQLFADAGRDQDRHELRQPFGQQQPGRAADHGEHDGLGEHLPELSPSARTESRADRKFLGSADRAREHQIRHVDAREQQQEPDDQEQRQHRAVLMIDQVVSQRDRGDRIAGQGLRVLLLDPDARRDRGVAGTVVPSPRCEGARTPQSRARDRRHRRRRGSRLRPRTES